MGWFIRLSLKSDIVCFAMFKHIEKSDHTTDPYVLSVTQVNHWARQVLEEQLPPLWIVGELSNVSLSSAGHVYFVLKDFQAQIRCVCFRSRLEQTGLILRDGLQVELYGQVSLYELRGDYQINVFDIRVAGQGRLFELFEKTKNRLLLEGLFDDDQKKSLPKLPQRIGIITSPTGAVLHDVVTTLKRRMAVFHLIIYPSLVQGELAAPQLVLAIETASRRQEVDVLLICRGGGSFEDLWPFNEEMVVRALAKCQIPTLSGIGHETDTTLCDFVADTRAPTPTAAAEMIAPDRHYYAQQFEMQYKRLQRALERLVMDKSQQLDYLSHRLEHPRRQIQDHLQTLRWQQQNMQHIMKEYLRSRQAWLDVAEARLVALDPSAILSHGYAWVTDQHGRALKHAKNIHDGQILHIHWMKDKLSVVAIRSDERVQERLFE